jgi:hypothetical protein
MNTITRKRRNNQYADFDERVFERGAKERAQVPIEYAGLQQRKKCPKGTRWHKDTKLCEANVNVLGDPIGALTETILVVPRKTVSFKKTKSKIPKSLSSSSPNSKTKSLSKRKLNFSSSSKKKKSSSQTSSAKLRKSKFMGLDDFYSSDVDLGKKIGLNDFLDSSSIKQLFNTRTKPRTKPKSSRSKSKSMSLNTAERADRQAFLDEENYSPTYNTAELADRQAFLDEDNNYSKPKSKTTAKATPLDSNVRFFGTQRIVSSKK